MEDFSMEDFSDVEISGLITRGKLLELVPRSDSQPDLYQLVLLMGVMPNDSSRLDIWVKLCPTKHSPYLPEDLEVRVLDEQGIAVMQAQSRRTNMLQLKFQGTEGERFSIEITLNDINLVETFII